MSDEQMLSHKRCAIYTRKSTNHLLERDINSLTTQREICGAYVASQRYRGWTELPNRYDDGGHSGSGLERPALAKLMQDIEAGQVDAVVIYKIDRLTRSLLDFVRLIDMFDRRGISLVSVSQAFDTSDSMGRMILNVLLTFSQFERELIAERVRDSIRTRTPKRKLFRRRARPHMHQKRPHHCAATLADGLSTSSRQREIGLEDRARVQLCCSSVQAASGMGGSAGLSGGPTAGLGVPFGYISNRSGTPLELKVHSQHRCILGGANEFEVNTKLNTCNIRSAIESISSCGLGY